MHIAIYFTLFTDKWDQVQYQHKTSMLNMYYFSLQQNRGSNAASIANYS